MGQFKKTVKGWKDDIANIWGRLTTFHRITLGCTLAILIIYAAREKLLDPLQVELADMNKSLESKGVPKVVPAIEEDTDVEDLKVRLENLERSSKIWRKKKEDSLKSRPQINRSNRSDVISEFELIVGKSGLILRNRSELNCTDTPEQSIRGKKSAKSLKKEEAGNINKNLPLDVAKYQYQLAGTFSSVHRFLNDIESFPYPSSLCCIEISTETDISKNTVIYHNEPQILLSFHLELYCHDK